MEFNQLLSYRQSTRKYKTEQITDEQIQTIIEAANHAPVGSNLYKDICITVVQNQDKLLYLCEAAWERFSSKEKVKEIAGDTVTDESASKKKPNLFYNAPTVFFISHRKQDLQAGIEWANVTTVSNQMHLAASNLGLGSCFMWGALESMRLFPELDHTNVLELPEGFEPMIALAVGYPEKELNESLKKHEPIMINIVK
jgi:nitroreductase